MRGILIVLLVLGAGAALGAEEEHPAFQDKVLTCKEMQDDPTGIFRDIDNIDLGSGRGSPLDVEYDCEGGLKSLSFMWRYLENAEAILGDSGLGQCSGTIVSANRRYYLFRLLEAGLAPAKLLGTDRYYSPNLDEYFETWGHASRSNFRLYRAFKIEEAAAIARLDAYYRETYGFRPEQSAAIAERASRIVRDRAAGSFPGSSRWSDRKVEPVPELVRAVIDGSLDVRTMTKLADASSQQAILSALNAALLYRRRLNVIRFLISKVDLLDQGDESPLFFALGNRSLTSLLLEKGASVNYQNGFGKTPLYYVIEDGDSKSLEDILRNHADVNHRYLSAEELDASVGRCNYSIVHNGRTPLMHAAQHGSPKDLALLIEYGAKLESVDDVGFGALDYASLNGNKPNADYLRSIGAPAYCKDGSFQSAYCPSSQ